MSVRRIDEPNHARFLTFSCRYRLPLFQNDAIKDAFVEQIERTRERTDLHLIAWVVMPEHVHLLIWPKLPEHPVADVTTRLKRPFARRVIQRWRALGAPILEQITDNSGRAGFWQPGGGYDRNIVSDEELREKVVYIHANPVRRGLVERPTEYRWSSAAWYAGDRDGTLSIDPGSRPD